VLACSGGTGGIPAGRAVCRPAAALWPAERSVVRHRRSSRQNRQGDHRAAAPGSGQQSERRGRRLGTSSGGGAASGAGRRPTVPRQVKWASSGGYSASGAGLVRRSHERAWSGITASRVLVSVARSALRIPAVVVDFP